MDAREIIDSLIEIEQIKNIDKQKVIEVVKQGLLKACETQFGKEGNYEVNVNEATGSIDITHYLTVVNNVKDYKHEMDLIEAQEIDPELEVGDQVAEMVEIREFGRRAINAMKDYIRKQLLDEERVSLFKEFSNRIDTLVNGSIKKITKQRVYVNLNRLEAIMPMEEAIPGERYRLGALIKAIIIDVKREKKDPIVTLSRKSNNFLKRLLEFEVPEIEDGTVVIKGIARRAGIKSKIAVMSIDDKIDPVGACVGVKGSRIRTIIKELNNEHIDIIQWSSDPIIFTQRVIAPGVVIRAFKNEEEKRMKLVVKTETYMNALGKDNINLELSKELTDWDIEVISEADFKDKTPSEDIYPIYAVKGITDNIKEKLVEAGYKTPQSILDASEEDLMNISGIGAKKIGKIKEVIREYLEDKGE